MTMERVRLARCLAATVAILGWAFGSLRAADPLADPALRAAVVSQASLLLVNDSATWAEAPIQAKMQALRAAAPTASGVLPLLQPERLDALHRTLGLEPRDVRAVVFSGRLPDLQGQTRGLAPQAVFEQLGLLIGVRLGVAVPVAKIRLAMANAAARDGIPLMFETGSYQGASTLAVVRPDQPGKSSPLPRQFLIAMLEDDTVAFVGSATEVKAAVDRLVSRTPAPWTDAMQGAQKLLATPASTRVLFTPSDALRASARERAARNPTPGPMSPGPALQALAGLQSLALTAGGAERVEMRLAAAFGNDQEAMQVKTLLDTVVLGMGKMMLIQALGRPIPFVNSLASRQDGTTLALDAILTEEDARALMELRSRTPPVLPPGTPLEAPVPAAPGV